MRLIYHPAARAELIEAARFYNGKIPGLGTEFLEELDRAIHRIQEDPARWGAAVGQARRYLVPRFPYAVFYILLPTQLYILAIKHHSRRPGYWQHRLPEQPDESEA